MTLEDWVNQQGIGAIVALQHKTKLSYTSVQKAVRRLSKPSYDTARRLSEATDGAVSIAEVYEAPRKRESTAKAAGLVARGKRRKAQRARKREAQPTAAARRA